MSHRAEEGNVITSLMRSVWLLAFSWVPLAFRSQDLGRVSEQCQTGWDADISYMSYGLRYFSLTNGATPHDYELSEKAHQDQLAIKYRTYQKAYMHVTWLQYNKERLWLDVCFECTCRVGAQWSQLWSVGWFGRRCTPCLPPLGWRRTTRPD